MFSYNAGASSHLSEINAQLVKMGKADVEVRKILKTLTEKPLTKDEKKKISQSDKRNTKILKSFLQKYGWEEVTSHLKKDGVDALFLVVQHSDDTVFQEKSLIKMEKLHEQKRISGQKLALLTDRVRITQGKEQLYGTQADMVDGQIVFKPIIDLDNLDSRRRSLKLPPIDFYRKILEEQYGIKNHGLIESN
jgi:hypothetical protein